MKSSIVAANAAKSCWTMPCWKTRSRKYLRSPLGIFSSTTSMEVFLPQAV
eukprot:CAMPEP_0115509076 /NCGR_PEP_ID=MMETSP0271-20121206/72653_1 /TAXON_ID=71861 /ORGANISM="Scrippsiella trochoidea, Strain CCMP3099" /LENGTH=49 /DNA_ID= /DNA_START= /DNA_END= /DNA_ORIENTATION=